MSTSPPVSTGAGPHQAIILAAGEGRRLRPITDSCPKPLVPFLNLPLIEHGLAQLVHAGVRRVALNAWYRAEELVAYAARRNALAPDGLELHVEVEQELLGTAGGIANLADWLDDGPVFVLTSDLTGPLDLQGLARRHAVGDSPATMLVVTSADVGRYGAIDVDANGQIIDIAGLLARATERPAARPTAQRGVNGSAHVLEPGFVARLPRRPACLVRDGYLPLLADDVTCGAHVDHGPWGEIGDTELLLDASARALDGRLPIAPALLARGGALRDPDGRPGAPGTGGVSLVHAGANIHPTAQVRASVIGADATVSARAVVHASIVMPGGRVEADAVLEQAIVPHRELTATAAARARAPSDTGTARARGPSDAAP